MKIKHFTKVILQRVPSLILGLSLVLSNLGWLAGDAISSAHAAYPLEHSQAATSIVINIGSGSLNTSGSLIIPLTADIPAGVDLSGAMLDIQFDPAVLNMTSCTSPLALGVCALSGPGLIQFSMVSMTPVTGINYKLADITFTALGATGTSSDLKITPTSILDGGLTDITASTLTVNGKISISGTPTTVTPSVTPPTVTPSVTPTTVTPSVTPITITPTITSTPITPKYSISGTVTDMAGTGVANVDIIASNGQKAKTDPSGNYTLTGLPAGIYTLSASSSVVGMTFLPASLTVNVSPSIISQDFQMVPIPPNSISGKVTDAIGKGIDGVTITPSIGMGTVTNINGEYLLIGVLTNVNITPSKAGCTFTPNPLNSVPTNSTAPVIIATCGSIPTFTISGKVTDSFSVGVPMITIADGFGGTTKTNASGDYTLSVPAGTYTITPSGPIGVTFTPISQNVTVTSANKTGIDFTMSSIGCTDIIKNGDFELNTDWYLPITKFPAGMKSPTTNDIELMEAATATYSSDAVHAGARSLRTGIINPAMNIYSYSSGWQQVTIPASASKAELNFWAYPSSMNGIDGIDVQLMLLLNTNKQEISRPVSMRSNDQTWKPFAVDLLPLAGQTVWIYFGTYNNGWGANMSMYVDDVSLEVCP